MRTRHRTTTLAGLAAVTTVMLVGPSPVALADSAAHKRPAVEVFSTHLPALATIGGVKVTGGGYGSGLTARPGSSDKIEPLATFTPAIGRDRHRPRGEGRHL
jgi:hypothetical protein